ncbi:MAG: hypothetical protein M3362_20060 [Acidobacteriota bacterium]|nr:hypothetical protein [Acidobacteriota bacterium]
MPDIGVYFYQWLLLMLAHSSQLPEEQAWDHYGTTLPLARADSSSIKNFLLSPTKKFLSDFAPFVCEMHLSDV